MCADLHCSGARRDAPALAYEIKGGFDGSDEHGHGYGRDIFHNYTALDLHDPGTFHTGAADTLAAESLSLIHILYTFAAS